MLSPAARNYFFGVDHWDYSSRPGPWRYQYWNLDTDQYGTWSLTAFLERMLEAVIIAIVSSRLGLAWGRSMSRIKR